MKLDANAVFLSFETIYWTVGCRQIFNSIYNGAVRVITSEEFTPLSQLAMIEKYKVTNLFSTPSDMTACLKSDTIHTTNLSSVKRIVFYGGKVPAILITDIKRYFPNAELFSVYGLTELGPILKFRIDIDRGKIDCGQLYYGCAVKIVDDDGNRCGPNVNGEIRVKRENHFLGYFNDPDASAAAIDEEGFFRTGDIGRFDDDGNLSVVDRKKNVMSVFYFDNVLLPSQIEDCLIQMPGVKEVCVVGVPIACGDCLPAAVIIRDQKSNLNRCDVFNLVAGKEFY